MAAAGRFNSNSSNNGNQLLRAKGNVVVSVITAGTGAVRIESVDGSILDVKAPSDTNANITADKVRLFAGGTTGTIGTSANALGWPSRARTACAT